MPFSKTIAFIPTLVSIFILIFYVIVIGWILKYFVVIITGNFSNLNGDFFKEFAGSTSSIPWHFLGVTITLIIVIFGIAKGIEKIIKIIMPALFIIFIVLSIRSLTLEGASEGLRYLFLPRWEYLLNIKTWVMALGQAFFTVSLTGSTLVAYGSYLNDDTDIINASFSTAIFDTLSAILASLVIIPAAFAFNISPTAGPSLLFDAIPKIFSNIPYGEFLAALFFLSIIFAAISSSISLLEVPTEFLISNFSLSRKVACIISASVCFISGIILDLNMDAFGAFSDFTTIIFAPIGILIAVIAYCWIIGQDVAIEEINKGSEKKYGKYFAFIGKYIFPIVTLAVLILGILYGGIG